MFGLMLDPVEKQLLPYKGHQICLLMKDGSRKIGQLTACASGRVILNGETGSDEAIISRKKSTRRADRRRTRKPQESPEPQRPQQGEEWDDLSFAPFGMEPPYHSMPRENVPLKTVESILVL